MKDLLISQFGVIANMELFGSSASNHWGVVDFREAVADFARESLDPVMEVKVASKEKSEERRKDRCVIFEIGIKTAVLMYYRVTRKVSDWVMLT